AVLVADAVLGQERPERRIVGDVEDALNTRLGGAAADIFGADPAAEDGADGVDDDRFAGPGFTRQHIQAWTKGQIQTFDNCEIDDAQLNEHSLMPLTRSCCGLGRRWGTVPVIASRRFAAHVPACYHSHARATTAPDA